MNLYFVNRLEEKEKWHRCWLDEGNLKGVEVLAPIGGCLVNLGQKNFSAYNFVQQEELDSCCESNEVTLSCN